MTPTKVEARAYSWHLQAIGDGPVMLLLHGAGASGQSFRHLITYLKDRHRLLIPDLPGHGQTRAKTRGRLRLDPIAEDLADLCQTLDVTPEVVVGHSAGAAMGARCCLNASQTKAFIALNGAFEMFEGMATWLFPLLAKTLAVNPLIAPIFARSMTRARVGELLRATGSQIDQKGQNIYYDLMRNRHHVDGVLKMMAGWSLTKLNQDLPKLQVPTLLIAGEEDRAVPPRVSQDLADRIPGAQFQSFQGLGHLIHEEAPEEITNILHAFVSGLYAQSP